MRGRINGAGALAVIGAGALLVGLFLSWFEPGISAWNAFEIVDLLLAAIAVGVLVVALAGSSDRPGLVALAGWLPVAALAALALVAVSLLNPPPAAGDGSLEIGAWVSLGGAALLVVGAVLATTEFSLVITVRPRRRHTGGSVEGATEGVAPPRSDPGWEPPPRSPVTEVPLEEPPFEEPPLYEPLEEPPPEEPPVDDPLEESATAEEPLEAGDGGETDDQMEPEGTEEDTQALHRDDRR
jgi:hypothetical protein